MKKPLPCDRRKRFTTQAAAQVAANHISAHQRVHRQPEACGHCNGWHLGPAR